MNRRGLFVFGSMIALLVAVFAGCRQRSYCPDGQCGVGAGSYGSYSAPATTYSSGPIEGSALRSAPPPRGPYVSQPSTAPQPVYGGSGTR